LNDIPKLNDIKHPRTQSCCSFGLVLNNGRVKLRVRKIVFLNKGNVGRRKFVIVDNLLEA
jgi:hypothetical protein